MSLVSAVSQALMDKCEIERNPISLAAVSAGLCTLQVLHAYVLCTCRDVHRRNAPDTQNRQYALMQKSMMPARKVLNQDRDPGSWTSESERASGTVLADALKFTLMMNMDPIFLRNSLQLGTYANSTTLRASLLQWCDSSNRVIWKWNE